MFDFKKVFLPVFDPCTTHSHLIFFFFTSYYIIFSSLAFRIRRSHCSYPLSSLSALVFISIQHLSVTFFSESPGTPGLYGQHGMSLGFPVLTGFPCKFFLKSEINVFPDPFFRAFGMVRSKLTRAFFCF